MVPLDELDQLWSRETIDIAINIHSFPETPIESIRWWIQTLASHGVRYLMIAANERCPMEGGELLSREVDGGSVDFGQDLLEAGYRLVAYDPKFLDEDVMRYGVRPPIWHHLFELMGEGTVR